MGNQWFSKDAKPVGTYNGLVDAVQVCKDQEYSGVINNYGGTSGILCNYANDKTGKNPSLNSIGYYVSWKCET